jgi:hypothetical protein
MVVKGQAKTTKIPLGRIQRMACLAITGAMKSTPAAAMEMLLNLTPVGLLIMAEVRMALNRLQILKRPTDLKQAGLLLIWKNVSDPILDMRSDYTIPEYHSKLFKVTIDRDYWRNKDPAFPEDALSGSLTALGLPHGRDLVFLAQDQIVVQAYLWANMPQFFKPICICIYICYVPIISHNFTTIRYRRRSKQFT